MDVGVDREQRVHVRDAEDHGAPQVPPSSQEELLHLDRGRSSRHAGRVAAEPRQRGVSGESYPSVSRCCVVELRI